MGAMFGVIAVQAALRERDATGKGQHRTDDAATTQSLRCFVRRQCYLKQTIDKIAEERHHVSTIFTWLPVGSLKIDAAFLADPLSITMALFVTGIGTLIHLYAVGYMHGDPRFSKFFLYLNLFAFSMLMLVLGENLLVTFLGWEGVGTCSYFLISFWHERESAATAGKKAFVTNRVGDWGFMMAMFFALWSLGSLDYLHLSEQASALSTSTATAIAARSGSLPPRTRRSSRR